ncbi:RanBP2-type zinc finger protein [Spatholobus suberectus]|nr:RanBP2-type zinc finger protein [Spatholobus suberectus]
MNIDSPYCIELLKFYRVYFWLRLTQSDNNELKICTILVLCLVTFNFDECLIDWDLQPAPITSPYRNSHPFYYGGIGVPPPSYGMPSPFGSPIPHSGIPYDYGLYARPRAPYSPLPMFPPGSFGGIDYGPRPRINGYGYGFQSPPWAEGLVADNFASRKRRGGPDGLSEGDWICPKCDNVNFAFRITCNMKHCGAARPSSNQPNTRVIPEGLSTTHLLNLVMNTLYKQFVEKDIREFDGFNVGILDTFNTINMALPGKHYVAPSYKDVKDLFEQWKETNMEDKKKMFTDFINEKVNLNKADESMFITAIVAPPAAMMAKKTGQKVPQLALLNAIPDVVFVPSATLLALIAIKIIRLMIIGKTTSKDIERSHVQPKPKQQLPTATAIEEEPQIATAPTLVIEEPQTPTAPATAIEEPQIATAPTPVIGEEPQTSTAIEEEPQTEQEPQTKPAPAPATEQEPQTTPAPAPATEEEPQIATAHIPQHIHMDNKFCALCDQLRQRMEGRSNAVALKT